VEPRTVARVIDLPPAIVWDGLVDPVLVEGWFDPELRLVGGEPASHVVERRDPERLLVRIEGVGELAFDAEAVPGGTRGTSTRLTVRSVLHDWEDRFDRLENLLRGHPTDWRETPAVRRTAN
jgi:hypothetical protein